MTPSVVPTFDQFPADQIYLTNTTYSPVIALAVASELNGTIVSVSAQVGIAISFVSFTIIGGTTVKFTIAPTYETSTGNYSIKVNAVDALG